MAAYLEACLEEADGDAAFVAKARRRRTFTWDQIGRTMMMFEGFTLNAIVEDTIEVVGGPLADGRLGSQASSQSAPAAPAPVIRPGASNRRTAKRGRPTRSWPPSPHRLDALIEEVTVDAYGESEQATAFLTALEEYLALPFGATVLGEAVVVSWRGRGRREDRYQRRG